MKRSVGTCPNCREEHPLDDGKHLAAHGAPWNRERNCEDSGKLCLEQVADNRAAAVRQGLARAAKMRADAEVAHDALAEGRPFPFAEVQRKRMIAAAIFEYRVKFPLTLEYKERGYRPRGNEIVIAVPRGRKSIRELRGRRSENATVGLYCTLCRLFQWQGSRHAAPYQAGVVEAEHTTLCAMRMLARLDEYVEPGRRRMPGPTVGEDGDLYGA